MTTTAVVMAAALLVVVVGSMLGNAVLDCTFDGRLFHREAVIQLAEGWNPLFQELTEEDVFNAEARARINAYPKAPWILAASLLKLSGPIESTSAFSLVLMVAAGAMVFAALVGIGRIGSIKALLLAMVAALNPIAVGQLATPLIDGQLASVLLIIVAASVLLYRTGSGLRARAEITSAFRIPSAPLPTPAAARAGPYLRPGLNREILNVARATPAVSLNRPNRICGTSGRANREDISARTLSLAVMLMAVGLGVNIKQSALPFVVLLVFGLVLVSVVVDRRLPRWQVLGAVAAALTVGVLFIGAHPHITNVVRYQNWAYPYSAEIAKGTRPTADHRIGRVHSFFKSAFSHAQHNGSLPVSRTLLASETHLKPLFSISAEELAPFGIHGVRIGGWGPLYGMMLMAALLSMVVLAVYYPYRAGISALILLCLALSVFAFPYPSVFRLVPQSWLLPLVPAAASLTSGRFRVAIFGWAIVIMAVVNLSLVTWVYAKATVRQSEYLRERYSTLATESPVKVHFGDDQAESLRLVDHGVKFTTVDNEKYWLGLFLGWKKPRVTVAEPRLSEAGPLLYLQWSGVFGVVEYRVRIIETPPSGPHGGHLLVSSQRVRKTDVIVQRPNNNYFATIEACNHLGCGPRVTVGPLEGAAEDRHRPFLGLPSQGDEKTTPVLLTWLSPSWGDRSRILVEDVSTSETVIDEHTANRYYRAKLPPHGHWRVRIVAEGDGATSSTQPVEFWTTTRSMPKLSQPQRGSTVSGGEVTLAWSAVDRSNSYEFLVTNLTDRHEAARGVTGGLTALVAVPPRSEPTGYRAIVRACPKGTACRGGEDAGWGPWSNGRLAADFTVVPNPPEPERRY